MARNPPPPENRQPILLAFGAAVRQRRKDKGFSQEAFADECEIDRSYMGGVERGERNIALTNVEKIISALGLQPSDFFKALDKPVKDKVQ
ncbi:MAG: helix-turn-helix transcriptional regulator [Rhodoferax sp.]|jgi:transcriptional regulator with XRE-family HTH domain|nr:helix-turn-helix domain-containing protein [Rhodoferax sp.]